MGLQEFRDRRGETKRAAVLRAAREAFARSGYAAASTAAIAQAAGVSTATLYRHFSTKADLFAAAVRAEVEALAGHLEQAEGDPETRLRRLAEGYAVMLCRPEVRGIVRAAVSEAGRHRALALQFHAAGKATVGALFAEAVSRLEEAGRLAADIPLPQAAGQLQGMIEHGALLPGLLGGDHAEGAYPAASVASEALRTWSARFLRAGRPGGLVAPSAVAPTGRTS